MTAALRLLGAGLLAQVGGAGLGGSVIQWAIIIVLIGGVVALVALGLKWMGVQIPPFVVQAFWIVVIVVVVIVAILIIGKVAGVV